MVVESLAVMLALLCIARVAEVLHARRRRRPLSPTELVETTEEATRVARDALARQGVPHLDVLARLASPAVRMFAKPVALDALALGASRFGGTPDVPPSFGWPERQGRPLTFLAQIDLAEAKAFDHLRRGWLLVFYDVDEMPWGLEPADAGGWVVRLVDASPSELVRRPSPPSGPDTPLRPTSLAFARRVVLPRSSDLIQRAASVVLTLEESDAYDRAYESLEEHDSGPRHQLGGHPDYFQSDMRRTAERAFRGLRSVHLIAPGTEGLEPSLHDVMEWRLLLQLDTDDAPGWGWADTGLLYFWIRRSDLEAHRFDRVWLTLESC